MSSPPPAPKKGKIRQPSPKRRLSAFSFGSPMYGSPGFNYGSPFESPLKKNKNSPSDLTNKKDAKPGRKVKQLGNEVVKSYEKDSLSQESLENELAVYKHLDSGEKIKIRDLINESFKKLNNASEIYPGINLIFPSIIKFEKNQLYLTYHDIKDVFINRYIIAPPYIDENGVEWSNDPELYEEDKKLRENIKTALEEYGIIYAREDDIDEEIKSNLFRTNDGNALLLDFETSEVKTSKGGRKKTNRKRNIKKRTRKKRNIKKN